MKNDISEKSNALFARSLRLVPGGVHSPVRGFKGLPRTPVFFDRGDGAYLYSVEGRDYIDFCMSFGPLILGHRDPEVEEKLKAALSRGWSFGAAEPYSLALAEFLVQKIPFIDSIRFVNSGTEAVMTALRLARGFTGRNKILKFHGCYHGHCDSMLIKAGSGLAGTSEASSAGIPASVAQETLVLELGDEQALEECFARHGKELAAVIVEPLPANYGLLVQQESFLRLIRSLSERHGTLLIFDEVISGFRISFTGMSGLLGITPDLVTYGKIIGGGMPVGAIAGRKDIMDFLAPIGPVYQAGTLSANPLAMVAGLATLEKLNDVFYQRLEGNAENICRSLQKYLDEKYAGLSVVRFHSLFWIKPGKDDPHAVLAIAPGLTEGFNRLFMDLLEKGIYLAPNAYEVGFISGAHDQQVQDELERRLWTSR